VPPTDPTASPPNNRKCVSGGIARSLSFINLARLILLCRPSRPPPHTLRDWGATNWWRGQDRLKPNLAQIARFTKPEISPYGETRDTVQRAAARRLDDPPPETGLTACHLPGRSAAISNLSPSRRARSAIFAIFPRTPARISQLCLPCRMPFLSSSPPALSVACLLRLFRSLHPAQAGCIRPPPLCRKHGGILSLWYSRGSRGRSGRVRQPQRNRRCRPPNIHGEQHAVAT